MPSVAADSLVRADGGRGTRVADRALVDHVRAVAQAEREVRVLLREQDRFALGLEVTDLLAEGLHDQRREASRRLVEEQEVGVAHECAPDRQHLLLPAGQESALPVLACLQVREGPEDLLDGPFAPSVAATLLCELQILHHRQVGEDAAILGDESDASPGDDVRRLAGEIFAAEEDPPAPWRSQAHDREDGRRLAGAVPPEEAHDLAGIERQRDAEERLEDAVEGVDRLDLEDHVVSPK